MTFPPPFICAHAPRTPRRSYAVPIWLTALLVAQLFFAALALPPWEARTPCFMEEC